VFISINSHFNKYLFFLIHMFMWVSVYSHINRKKCDGKENSLKYEIGLRLILVTLWSEYFLFFFFFLLFSLIARYSVRNERASVNSVYLKYTYICDCEPVLCIDVSRHVKSGPSSSRMFHNHVTALYRLSNLHNSNSRGNKAA